MVWRALVQLLRAVWLRLCGWGSLQATDTNVAAERQTLLGPDATPSSAASSPEPHRHHAAAAAAAVLEPLPPCTLIVLRHGHRQDEEDPFWHQTAARPWDPPLSAKGKTQAAEAAGKLSGFKVDYVISSPFKRCLQTAAGVVRGLAGQLQEGHWLVDWQLAEVCEARVLFGVRADARSLATDSDPEAWMWGGTRTAAALEKFTREDCRLQKLPMQPVLRDTPRPVYPEDLDDGLTRYSRAMQEISTTFAGHTVLLVTHGECVRQAVLMAEPSSEVFEVQHTGYVVLRHAQQQQQQQPSPGGSTAAAAAAAAARRKASWQLTSGCGETGVLWLEDDD